MSFILLGILNSQAAGAVAGGTYDLLETTVLGSDTASVSFTGLGAYTDYKHLQIRATARTNRANEFGGLNMIFNSDTTTSYANHELFGDGTSVASEANTSRANMRFALRAAGGTSPANSFGAGVMDILDFSSASKNTTIRSLTGNTDGLISLISGGFFKTDAITSLTLGAEDATLIITGSRFSLYGIRTA